MGGTCRCTALLRVPAMAAQPDTATPQRYQDVYCASRRGARLKKQKTFLSHALLECSVRTAKFGDGSADRGTAQFLCTICLVPTVVSTLPTTSWTAACKSVTPSPIHLLSRWLFMLVLNNARSHCLRCGSIYFWHVVA